MRICIQKRAEVSGGAPARPHIDHVDGQEQPAGFSLPLDYEIEGDLIGTIAVGLPVLVARDTRNGVKMSGQFMTSVVTEVTENQFRTQNSVYNYKFL